MTESLQHGKIVQDEKNNKNVQSVVDAIKKGLEMKRREAARSKDRALELARELRAKTKHLSARRMAREASDEGCFTLTNKEEEAEDAIEEYESCEGCQKKN